MEHRLGRGLYIGEKHTKGETGTTFFKKKNKRPGLPSGSPRKDKGPGLASGFANSADIMHDLYQWEQDVYSLERDITSTSKVVAHFLVQNQDKASLELANLVVEMEDEPVIMGDDIVGEYDEANSYVRTATGVVERQLAQIQGYVELEYEEIIFLDVEAASADQSGTASGK